MTLVCVDPNNTLLVDGADIQIWAAITNAEGLLSNPPQRGDLIEQDWVAGAIWQPGPKDTWTFDVPIIMRYSQQDVALAQLRHIQGWVGTTHTLTRRLVINGVTINETCTAVMINSPQVQWDFSRRAQVRAVMVWQGLTPWV